MSKNGAVLEEISWHFLGLSW